MTDDESHRGELDESTASFAGADPGPPVGGPEDETLDLDTADLLPPLGELFREGDASIGGRVPEIEGYRLIEPIGEGGMGVVWKAEQNDPRRLVALKFIRLGNLSPGHMRRFRQEAQLLGRLQHPAIAQIFEANTADVGHRVQPYFAMEFIEGQIVTKSAWTRKLSIRERLELIVKIAEGVQHAHQRGIIHRDLKPGNILVDSTGHPKILDFGIARATDQDDDSPRETMEGTPIGTYQYMSPEQAAGELAEVDTLTDVYALGVIAYELLSGSLPLDLRGKPATVILSRIRDEPPMPLGRHDKALAGDIEIMIGKALAKEKSRRYQGVGEFASDIRRYLNHEPIAARPPNSWYVARKFVQKNKTLVGSFAIVLAFAVIAATVSTMFAIGEARQRAVTDDAIVFLEEAFSTPIPGVAGPDVTVRQVFDKAAPMIDERFATAPEARLRLHETFGTVYRALNQYGESEYHTRRALETARDDVAGDAELEARLLGALGTVVLDRGRTLEALDLFRQQRARLATSGVSDAEIAADLDQIAGAYHDLGDYSLAETYYRNSLTAYESSASPGSDAARVRNMLARLLADAGYPAEAHAEAKAAIAALHANLGEQEEKLLAFALLTLGYCDYLLGEYQASYVSYKEGLAIYRRLLGGEQGGDVFTVRMAEMDLAGLLEDASAVGQPVTDVMPGDREWSPDFFEGDLRFIIAISLRNRGRHLMRAGFPESGEARFRESLVASRDISDQPLFEAHTRRAWAKQLRLVQRVDDGLEQIRSARELLAGVLDGDTRVAMASYEIEYGRLLAEAGRTREAEEAFRAALRLRLAYLDPETLPVATAERALGRFLERTGRDDEARPLLDHARRVFAAHLGADHPRVSGAGVPDPR